jgi:hypothetical protein
MVRSDTFGIPDWTPLTDAVPFDAEDLAIVTWVDEDCLTPVRVSSWGSVKAWYESDGS